MWKVLRSQKSQKVPTVSRAGFTSDEEQVRRDAEYDGIFVLRTDTEHDAEITPAFTRRCNQQLVELKV